MLELFIALCSTMVLYTHARDIRNESRALPISEPIPSLHEKDDNNLRCIELSCGDHSKCFELSPAICRCDEGYVLSTVTNTCSNERLLVIKGLKLKEKWNEKYSDVKSTEFIRFSGKTEKLLMALFHAIQMPVDGVKVLRASRNESIALDITLIYAKLFTKEEAYEDFEANLKYAKMKKYSPDQNSDLILGTNSEPAPENKAHLLATSVTALVFVIAVPLVLLIIILVLVIKISMMKKTANFTRRHVENNNDMFVLSGPDFEGKLLVKHGEAGRKRIDGSLSNDSGLDMMGGVVYEF